MESFSSFFQKKKTRRPNLPKGEELEGRHDEHVDAVMHHLYELHKRTHPSGEYTRCADKLGYRTSHIDDLHKSVSELIKKHGGQTQD